MIKTLLKHKIVETCIDTIFSALNDNFPTQIDGMFRYKLIDGCTYEFMDIKKPCNNDQFEIWHLYNPTVYKKAYLHNLGEVIKVVSSTAIYTLYDDKFNSVGTEVIHNDTMYLSESWITTLK